MVPQLLPSGPYGHVPLTGTKGRGLTYQKKVGKVLAKEATNLGWEFLDHWWLCSPIGIGQVWKQPDFILISPSSCAIVFEAKLTWVDCTFQLTGYINLLLKLGYPSFGVTVCRNLTPAAPEPITNFYDISTSCTWHLLL